MDFIFDFFRSLQSQQGLENLIRTGGLFVLIAIVFAETGLLIGFFLPGDSLLVTAGVIAAKSPEHLSLNLLLVTLVIAAVVGDQVGFLLGRKTGHRIFSRPDGKIFKKKHVEEAKTFYERHGGKAIVMARFIPVLRTFVPFIAGVTQMNYRRFFMANWVGGVLWVLSLTLLGYFIGQSPLGKQLHLVILIVVLISLLPILIPLLKRLILSFKAKKT